MDKSGSRLFGGALGVVVAAENGQSRLNPSHIDGPLYPDDGGAGLGFGGACFASYSSMVALRGRARSG